MSRQQINLFLAGQGSGKTHCAGLMTGRLIAAFPNVHGFIGANTYTQLSDSTLFRIRNVWKEIFGWTEYTKGNPAGNFVVDVIPPAHFNTKEHEYDSYHGKICFASGTVIYKGSLDNYKAHDGKEFAWAILDETKDTKEEAVKEVITGRLREPGMWVSAEGELTTGPAGTPFNPLYIFTSPAKVPWINEWFRLDDYQDEIKQLIYSGTTYFCKKIDNKLAVISSSYHNAPNLPSNFIDNQKSNLHTALQDMLIYGNPFSQSGGEFYKCFDRSRHVANLTKIDGFDAGGGKAYNKTLALHVTFDFNVSPYMTCCIWQVVGKKAYQIDEICLENPRNTTPDVCKELIRRYQGHNAGMFIYGDPSGKQEDTRQEKGSNDFTLILRSLLVFKPSLRIASAAPPVVMRGNFINTIFEKGYAGIEIWIHDKCVKSIADYNYLKEASDGTKLKEKVKNPDTSVTYEKYGHCFVGQTMVQTDSGKKRIDRIVIGDKVLTRNGYKKVIKVFDNGIQDVESYKVGNTNIVCTPDHLFFTKEKEFQKIKSLLLMPAITFCIFDEVKQSICHRKLSITMGSHSTGIQNQKTPPIENIFLGTSSTNLWLKKCTSIVINGLWKSVKYLRGFTSITRMAIPRTMMSKISNVSTVNNTCKVIIEICRKRQRTKGPGICFQGLFQNQRNGISLLPEENGTKSTPAQLGRCKLKSVKNVENLLQSWQTQPSYTVRPDAGKEVPQGPSGRKERVYDLQVEDQHEYFANGILVHNCSDAGDYFLCMAFAQEFAQYQAGGSIGKTSYGKNAPPKHAY